MAENSPPALQRNLDLFFLFKRKVLWPQLNQALQHLLCAPWAAANLQPLALLRGACKTQFCAERAPRSPLEITLLRSWDITLLHVSATMLK